MERTLAAVHRWLPFGVLVILGGQSFWTLRDPLSAPAVWLVWLVALPLALRWPVPTIIGASLILRIGFADRCCADQIIVSQSAWERVLSGAGPYGVGTPRRFRRGRRSPTVRWPSSGGCPGRSWSSPPQWPSWGSWSGSAPSSPLAVFALWQASIRPQWVGINDYSPVC